MDHGFICREKIGFLFVSIYALTKVFVHACVRMSVRCSNLNVCVRVRMYVCVQDLAG